MKENHPITVDVDEHGQHVCRPTRTRAKPGDTVQWLQDSKASVSFPGNTPFVQGEGPFPPGSFSTVKGVPPLNFGAEFVPVVNGNKIKGAIIIDKGD
jgi:hypothetical protein